MRLGVVAIALILVSAGRLSTAAEMLADYYGIPSINMAMRVAELAREKKLIFQPPIAPETKAELAK